MGGLNLYGINVQYDKRPLGLYQINEWSVTSRSVFRPRLSFIDPQYWQKYADEHTEQEFVDSIAEMAEAASLQAQGKGNVSIIVLTHEGRRQVRVNKPYLQNTADFCNKVLAALGGK